MLQVFVGLVVTFVVGLGVGPLVRCVGRSMDLPPPTARLHGEWAALMKGNEGGRVLGYLERLFFFGALWAKADFAVVAWLAFKVASKWNAWSNVISVPKEIENVDPIEFLIARRCWGSHVLSTFLIGTLANIVAGGVGVAFGRYIYPLLIALNASAACSP